MHISLMDKKKYEKRLKDQVYDGASREKITKTSNRLNMYRQRDKKRQTYVENTSVKKQLVKDIIMTPIGAGAYNRYRAAGVGRAASIIGTYGFMHFEPFVSGSVERTIANNEVKEKYFNKK